MKASRRMPSCPSASPSPRPRCSSASTNRAHALEKAACSTRAAANRATWRSRQEVERIRHLEGHLGMAARKVALLVADIGDDDETLRLDVDAGGGLVVGHAAVAGGIAHIEMIAGNGAVAGAVEIAQRIGARHLVAVPALPASGDEEHLDLAAAVRLADAACGIVELKRRRNRLRQRALLPVEIAAGVAGLEVASAAADEREIVLVDARPVRQRGLVDVEHDRGPCDLRRPRRDPALRIGKHLGDIVLIGGTAVVHQLLLEDIDVGGLAEIGHGKCGGGVAAEPGIDWAGRQRGLLRMREAKRKHRNDEHRNGCPQHGGAPWMATSRILSGVEPFATVPRPLHGRALACSLIQASTARAVITLPPLVACAGANCRSSAAWPPSLKLVIRLGMNESRNDGPSFAASAS